MASSVPELSAQSAADEAPPVRSAEGESPATEPADAPRVLLYFGQGVAEHRNEVRAPLPYIDPVTGELRTAAFGMDLTDVGMTTLRSRVRGADQRRADVGLLWGGWLLGISYNRLSGDSEVRPENPPPVDYVGGSFERKVNAGVVSYRFRRDAIIQPTLRGTYSRAAVDYTFENVLSYNTATLAYDYTRSLSGQGRVEVYQALAGVGFEARDSGLRFEPYYRYQRARLRLTVSGPTSQPVLVRESPLLAIPNPAEIAAAAIELHAPIFPVRASATEETVAHFVGAGLTWQPLRFLRFEISGGADLNADASEAAASALFFFHPNVGLRVTYTRGDSGAGGETRELTGGPVFTATF